MKKIWKLMFFLSLLLSWILMTPYRADAATSLGNGDCGHWDWRYLDDTGRIYIKICSPDRDFGIAVLQVSGLSGKQFYYRNFPAVLYLSLSGNPCGMRLDSNTASVFPYTFCGDCGSPYIQEFSVPIHWQMPAYYEFAGTPYVQNSGGTTTLQQFVDHRDFIWKDYYFINRLPNGGNTLTSQAFTVSASTFYDLGIRVDTPSGIVVQGPRTVTIQLQKQTFSLQVNPNGGSWEGSTGISVRRQQWGTSRSIGAPVPPAGYTVYCNANKGEGSKTLTAGKVFTGWSRSGSGTINGSTYTFGTGNGSLTANYRQSAVTLPAVKRIGYLFQGWYLNGKKVGDAGTVWTPTGSVTLTASWKPVTYTVSYHGNGNTGGNTVSSKHTYDVAQTLNTNGFIRDKALFQGWSTSVSSATVRYTDRQTVQNLSSTQDSVIHLYAVWKKTITLSYDANGGRDAPSAETRSIVNADSANFTISPLTPEKDGCRFLGWSTKPDTNLGSYQPAQQIMLGENTTLYAIWDPILEVEAFITRTLEPHDPVFKTGEQGILTIKVYGMCEKVKVSFPQELISQEDEWNPNHLDQEYDLSPAMSQELTQEFYVPLYTQEGAYTTEVTAYKTGNDGNQLTKTVYPQFRVSGNMLDELKTRIRLADRR
ncbi:InlB B-repeat-containing protein [Diplocloster hominis]|uniref:InlB B-repeat-containing protein n=1 Tax=Diplocloster hominis TaxID=3079010 RepID=UPI0031BAD197